MKPELELRLHADATRWRETLDVPPIEAAVAVALAAGPLPETDDGSTDFDDLAPSPIHDRGRAASATRRRPVAALLAVAAVVILAAATLTGVLLTRHDQGRDTVTSSGDLTRRWTYDGLEVFTPPSFRQDAVRCATAIADTVIYATAFSTCAIPAPHVYTVVEVGDGAGIYGTGLTNGVTRRLRINGLGAEQTRGTTTGGTPARTRFIVITKIISTGAAITVSSPDESLAERITDTLRRA